MPTAERRFPSRHDAQVSVRTDWRIAGKWGAGTESTFQGEGEGENTGV